MSSKTPARRAAAQPPVPPAAPSPAEKEATRSFVKGLVERGEAVVPGSDGALPSGATHEIKGTAPDGTPIVQRRRFSTF